MRTTRVRRRAISQRSYAACTHYIPSRLAAGACACPCACAGADGMPLLYATTNIKGGEIFNDGRRAQARALVMSALHCRLTVPARSQWSTGLWFTLGTGHDTNRCKSIVPWRGPGRVIKSASIGGRPARIINKGGSLKWLFRTVCPRRQSFVRCHELKRYHIQFISGFNNESTETQRENLAKIDPQGG
ncbi:hypothetical protein RR46_04716 [Papilio xuthus]|uniref:Uncharacterized protein n=1 Tax=Papilio xuthus TaxID=66420 RepID=A0A194Q2E6_PAPXU|nr:hypothetical protein RR46_04716 [Papilio xuthus]